MRTLIATLLVLLCAVIHAYSGDFDPNRVLQPSLEARVRNSALIVLTSVEVQHGFIAYKVLETWKGIYDSRNFPDQYKGYFTAYIRPGDYYQRTPRHSMEIRLSGKAENIFSPAPSQPNPETIYFNPSAIYPDMCQLPIIDGTVIYPLRIRGGDEKVLDEHEYTFQEIKTAILKLVKRGSN